MPACSVYVGRPSKWGNPWPVGRAGIDGEVVADAHAAVARFKAAVDATPHVPGSAEIRRELRGRDLVCWCPLEGPCHADVLLEIANDAV
jgi:hypothetical protein